MVAKARIKGISIHTVTDEYPDLSHYGKYTSKYGIRTVDLERSGLWRGPGHYKYFESASVSENNTDEENRLYAAQDLARMEEYERGDWQSVGVCAEAEIEVPLGKKMLSDEVERCVFGNETDGGGAYLTEIAKEELNEVKHELREMGFTDKQIDAAPFDGHTELFDYGDTDVYNYKEHTMSVVFVSDPEEEEPEEITVYAKGRGFQTPAERGQKGTQATLVLRRPNHVKTYHRRH